MRLSVSGTHSTTAIEGVIGSRSRDQYPGQQYDDDPINNSRELFSYLDRNNYPIMIRLYSHTSFTYYIERLDGHARWRVRIPAWHSPNRLKPYPFAWKR
jgi:hypothetical protein